MCHSLYYPIYMCIIKKNTNIQFINLSSKTKFEWTVFGHIIKINFFDHLLYYYEAF